MPDELIVTQAEAPVATGPSESYVDQTPDPASLQADIERLQALREQREKEAKEAEDKAVYWRKQKAESRAEFFKEREKPPTPAPTTPEPLAAPRKEDFDDYDKYVEAVTDHKVSVKLAQWRAEEDRKRSSENSEKRLSEFQTRLQEGYQAYPDFGEVIEDPSLPVTAVMRDGLAELEHPADVAYYLGKNRAEAIKLSRMTPLATAQELARIEVRLMAEKGNPNPGGPKLPSAPPPIRPLGSSNTVDKSLEKMTQKEFEAEMEKRTGRRF